VPSIQIYFEGVKFFPSQGGGERSPRPEGPRAGMGFLGRGSEPSPHQLGVWGSAVSSPSVVRGGTPGNFEIWCNLRPQMHCVVQKCLITCKLLQKGQNIEGANGHSRPGIFIAGAIAPFAPLGSTPL